MVELIEQAYAEAVNVLDLCATPHGFNAANPGYNALWSRDSMITSLGASLIGKFSETFRKSLITLANHQADSGQIPNAVDIFSERKPHVDFASIDSTLWFLIGHLVYSQRFGDALKNKHKKEIELALNWMTYQDMGEDGMPEQLPTTDWEDAFPHKYGHTINTQALYYYVLSKYNKKQAAFLKKTVNTNKDKGLWHQDFYYAWRWKNHNKYHEFGEWFDSLGNILAIVFDLATSKQAEKILEYIKREKINAPFPLKAIYPPILKNSKHWHDYFDDCEARTPYHYLNSGIWTYIGAFYVLALIRMRKFREAEEELERLAEANLQRPYFSEWLNGKTGKPGSSQSGSREGNQAWNAGTYILAYESFKKKRVLLP